ncbi:MAG TPA: hypothetical protein V6C78_21800 [Crinalium sp.]|jgi:hypothetical protein
MSRNTESNEIQEIIKGILLLLLFHILAGAIIFLLGFLIGFITGGYSIFVVWIVGSMGFLFWQLLYVIPLVLRLKRRGKIGMMKGVIICAVFTALVNGACFLTTVR